MFKIIPALNSDIVLKLDKDPAKQNAFAITSTISVINKNIIVNGIDAINFEYVKTYAYAFMHFLSAVLLVPFLWL